MEYTTHNDARSHNSVAKKLEARVLGTLVVKPGLRDLFLRNPYDALSLIGISATEIDVPALSRALHRLTGLSTGGRAFLDSVNHIAAGYDGLVK
jgi:hypothetical protein